MEVSGTTLQQPSALGSVLGNTHLVGGLWIISSAVFSTYSTTKFLKYEKPLMIDNRHQMQIGRPNSKYPSFLNRPTLLTLYRFGGSLLLGLLLHPNYFDIVSRVKETIQVVPAFLAPALFLFIANFTNSISLNRIGISLTYTSKCGIPLMTVLLTLLLDGGSALPPFLSLLSLIPIALGIALASWNSPTFEPIGFMAAMVSCAAQSALNVFSKRAMSKTGLAGPQAQRAMVTVGFIITILYSFGLLFQSPPEEGPSSVDQKQPPTWLSGMAVTAYHIEYLLSFMFVKLVAPITYGACDAVRRLSIIISGRRMFGGSPFSRVNKGGIAMALLGALAYSITSTSGKR